MIDDNVFLSWFFAKTQFNRFYVFSQRIGKEEVRQRRILIFCLISLGYGRKKTQDIMGKTSHCISDAIYNITNPEKKYAEKLIAEWNEKMREMSSHITAF